MLTTDEIKQFIQEDIMSDRKRFAKKGMQYYEGRHDIKDYKLYYYNDDGILCEDKYRSNVKICHPYFKELVDQAVQYILSGKDGYIHSKKPELQAYMDEYFNENEDFTAELSEAITGCMTKGYDYMYAYKNHENKTAFMAADSLGVVEVEAKFASDNEEHIIYWYVDRINKDKKLIKRIMVWDAENIHYFTQEDDGEIKPDMIFNGGNVKPHTTYQKDNDAKTYYKGFGFIPFFRLDNNKKRVSDLMPIKDLIDDYDLMASSLSNNLIDFDTPIHIVKGFEGDSLDELQQNLKTKKLIGLEDSGGGLDIKTVDVPYQARQIKLELDEKNIYRFGMGK